MVSAHMRGDDDSILALLSVVDEEKLFPMTVDFLVDAAPSGGHASA